MFYVGPVSRSYHSYRSPTGVEVAAVDSHVEKDTPDTSDKQFPEAPAGAGTESRAIQLSKATAVTSLTSIHLSHGSSLRL